MIDLVVFYRALGFLILMPLGVSAGRLGARIIIALIVGGLFGSDATQTGSPFLDIPLGLVLALPIAIIPSIMNTFGSIFDAVRGQSLGSIYDPFSNNSSPLFGLTLEKFAWLIILGTGGLEEGLRSVILSKELSLSSGINWTFTGAALLKIIAENFIAIWGTLIPFSILCIAAEVLFILAGKLLPKGSFNGESLYLKSFLGIGMLVLVLQSEIFRPDIAGILERGRLVLKESSNG
jgi:type III secretory pathway component EscT